MHRDSRDQSPQDSPSLRVSLRLRVFRNHCLLDVLCIIFQLHGNARDLIGLAVTGCRKAQPIPARQSPAEPGLALRSADRLAKAGHALPLRRRLGPQLLRLEPPLPGLGADRSTALKLR